MKRPIVSKKSLDLQSNHFLRRNPGYPLGASFGELDYLRGWEDDFFGRAVHPQYLVEIVGAGSTVTFLTPFHGGALRLTSGPAAGRYARLWLGDGADGYATLDADYGWVQITRMAISHTTNLAINFGAMNSTGNDYIFAGINTTVVAANWSLLTRTGGGALNNVDSGVAADTDWHWHVLDVFPITGGRQVDYYIDGSLIATTTVSVPIIVLTPIVYCYSAAAAIRNVDLDYWAVIPRNL